MDDLAILLRGGFRPVCDLDAPGERMTVTPTPFDWTGLWQFAQFAITSVIGYLMWRQTHAINVTSSKVDTAVELGTANSGKLDNVVSQTNGMTHHLVALQDKVSHAKGMKDEKARAASGVFQDHVGPDRLNAGKTDEPA